MLGELVLPPVLRLLFLVYPLVTNIAFKAWPCYDFEGGASYLMVDVDVECGTPAHDRVKAVA